MKKHLFVLTAVLVSSAAHAQTKRPPVSYPYLPSDSFLQSGLVLSTERERQYSMRIEALGRDLSGIVSDQITDLYRNPAFFGEMKSSLVFADVVRVALPASSGSLAGRFKSTGGFESGGGTTTGLRVGYVKTFGVLVRGNYSNAPSQTSSSPSLSDVRFEDRQTKSRRDWGEAQLSYGFSLGNGLKAGISYTFGTSEVFSGVESATTRLFSRLSITTFDSTYDSYLNATDGMTQTRSHIGRFGILSRAANGAGWDAVATVEVLTADVNSSTLSRTNYYDLDRWLQDGRQYISHGDGQSTTLNDASIDAINVRLDANLVRISSPTRTFVAQLGLGLSSYSSADKMNSSESSSSFRQSISDTTQSAGTSTTNLAASPDGFGFQVRACAGWSFRADKFTIVPAILAHYQRLSYDYVSQGEFFSSTSISTSDTVIAPPDIHSSGTASNEHEVFFYRIAAPLGIEYRLSSKFDLRAGAIVELVGNKNEKKSTASGYRNENRRLNFSNIQVGAGLKISERFRADVVTQTDITLPNNWNVTVLLNF